MLDFFALLYLVTQCLVVAVQLWMKLIPVFQLKKRFVKPFCNQPSHFILVFCLYFQLFTTPVTDSVLHLIPSFLVDTMIFQVFNFSNFASKICVSLDSIFVFPRVSSSRYLHPLTLLKSMLACSLVSMFFYIQPIFISTNGFSCISYNESFFQSV